MQKLHTLSFTRSYAHSGVCLSTALDTVAGSIELMQGDLELEGHTYDMAISHNVTILAAPGGPTLYTVTALVSFNLHQEAHNALA